MESDNSFGFLGWVFSNFFEFFEIFFGTLNWVNVILTIVSTGLRLKYSLSPLFTAMQFVTTNVSRNPVELLALRSKQKPLGSLCFTLSWSPGIEIELVSGPDPIDKQPLKNSKR